MALQRSAGSSLQGGGQCRGKHKGLLLAGSATEMNDLISIEEEAAQSCDPKSNQTDLEIPRCLSIFFKVRFSISQLLFSILAESGKAKPLLLLTFSPVNPAPLPPPPKKTNQKTIRSLWSEKIFSPNLQMKEL